MRSMNEANDEDVNQLVIDVDKCDALKDSSRNFNMGELAFALKPETGKVYNIQKTKIHSETTNVDCSPNIMVLATVCANGETLPPLVIYPRKRISRNLEERFPNHREFAFIVRRSQNIYLTRDTLNEYFVHSFSTWLIARKVKKPVVLWTDCHPTQNNQKLAKTLMKCDIILYNLTSTDPGDRSISGPVGSVWGKAAYEWEKMITNGIVNATNFTVEFIPLYYKHYTPGNIRGGFRKYGLFLRETDVAEISKVSRRQQALEKRREPFDTGDEGKFNDRR